MTMLYLRTNTKAEMTQALSVLQHIDGNLVTDTLDYSVTVIGKLQTQPVYGVTGQQTVDTFPDSHTDPETGEIILGDSVPVTVDVTGIITPAKDIPGFHANYVQLQGETPPEILAIALNPDPANPLVRML
jgi:hypothetical protein